MRENERAAETEKEWEEGRKKRNYFLLYRHLTITSPKRMVNGLLIILFPYVAGHGASGGIAKGKIKGSQRSRFKKF